MQIPVGRLSYDLVLVADQPQVNHDLSLGSFDPVAQRIEVWAALSPQRRLMVGWHEIAHAWRDAIDIRPDQPLDDEAYAHLISRAMAAMDPELMARLHIYLTRGIEANSVVVYPGHGAVPLVAMSG